MYNNLTFLSNPVNKALMLIHLTLWTFSVGSYREGLGIGGCFFASFFAPKKVRDWGLGVSPNNNVQPLKFQFNETRND